MSEALFGKAYDPGFDRSQLRSAFAAALRGEDEAG